MEEVTDRPFECPEIKFYYMLYKNGQAKMDFRTNIYEFADGQRISVEFMRDYDHKLVVDQNRLYWNSLPWWKRLFKAKPNYI